MSSGDRQAFENVKSQIGFCGIWCGSCVVGNGTLRKLTEKYSETTTAYGLPDWAPKDFDHAEFSRGLASIRSIPECPGCLRGGGRDDCEIRACALEKGLPDCTLCEQLGRCEHREIVNKMRSGALAAGLCVREPGQGERGLLEDWSQQLERRWPCCILFLPEETP